ncbi:MAG: porin [Saprospiraceae bacterium]|nr:porin [Saprospiraceae bacterium]
MTTHFTLKGFTIACLLFVSNIATAQDTTQQAVAAPLSISGHVDAYFRQSSNEVAGKTSYSDAAKGFGFGMANLQLSKDAGNISFMADVMFGPRAEGTNYYYAGANSSSLAFIKQLYVAYKPTDKLKFTLGNFMTFVGYELAEASNNLNYSMSYNYTNGPFYHTGLKMDYQFTEKFGGMIGVFNRTDTKLDNGKKFVGGQLSYVSGAFKLYLNGLTGEEVDSSKATTLDATLSYQATSKLGLGFNVINKSVKDGGAATNWTGTALYLNYAFTDKFTLAARGEYLLDKKGLLFGADDNAVTAFTLSGNFKVDALTIIPEIRFDSGKSNIFSTADLDAKGLPVFKGSETAFILAAVYKF